MRDICAAYGVLRQSTAGYTPEHNAFIERWFRTNAEMSRSQMQQFDMEETFIYNRVPPARRTPGKPWMSPSQQQYPVRPCMDMSRLQPFGPKCFVYQVKEM